MCEEHFGLLPTAFAERLSRDYITYANARLAAIGLVAIKTGGTATAEQLRALEGYLR